jgi:hypothetical protein
MVWELDGPIPTLKMSKTLNPMMPIVRGSAQALGFNRDHQLFNIANSVKALPSGQPGSTSGRGNHGSFREIIGLIGVFGALFGECQRDIGV